MATEATPTPPETALTPQHWEEIVLCNDELVKRAKARDATEAAQKEAVAAAIAPTIDQLIKYGCVDATQREALAVVLGDQVKTLEFVRKLAARTDDSDGVPVPAKAVTKRANHHSGPTELERANDRLIQQSRLWSQG